MRSGWEIHPHARGPWLLRIGHRSFLLPARVGRQLNDPAAGEARSALLARILEQEDESPGPGGRVWLWVRLTLLPGRLVRRLAGRLALLCGLRLLIAQGLAGLGLMIWFLGHGLTAAAGPASAAWPLALTLFLLSALWHELGHAAALSRAGYPPGRIGAGLLLIIPVLYSDVTAVAALDRRGRTRVNLGGIGFHLAAGGLLALVGWAIHLMTGAWLQTLLLAELSILAAVSWSLVPFFRSDGYWLLVDLLGLPDLDRPVPPGHFPSSQRATRLLAAGLTLYRLGHAAFLAWVGYLLPLRYAAKLQAVLPRPPEWFAGLPVRIVLGLLVLMVWLAMGRRILGLLRSCRLDLLTALDYHRR